ncbi:MAG: type I DNA topoisomerase [Synergistetes bacterium]|nr:type I DNA topoisomerase [Synergistota bacterium]MCX8127611.1 type I DNA topoisomerase [Synergistota bacterium]MDW8191472.1 type I DNA topoisomerase [Synergistota bacterium]
MQGRRFLILVESPTKAKTIRKFLGKEYEVKATLGHIKDLPVNSLGVDRDTFHPTWLFLRGKKKLLEEISSREAFFLIATDPDREGERIAFDVWNFLRSKGLSAKRIEFHEITYDAIREAINNPKDVNISRVKSAVSRRILDRLYGYLVSPVLCRGLKLKGLSAGRVQSCALKMIVDREKERERFTPQEWYELRVNLDIDGFPLEAKLWDPREDVPLRLRKEEAESLQKALEGGLLELRSLEFEEHFIPPPPPLKTATLIQKASSFLGLSSSLTMKEAQELFEKGYITYHRTDSLFLSNRAIDMAVSFIRENFGETYIKVRRYETEGTHEAIRPTDVKLIGVSPLYDLIWKTFIASQTSDAKLLKERALFLWKDKCFLALGERILFDGWTKILKRSSRKPLPYLAEGNLFRVNEISIFKRKTQPPPRYKEATLVRELEKKGVGRPSTYANIISTLLKRKYVIKRGGFIIPTKLGVEACSFLERLLGEEFLSPQFTSYMEDSLDKIESNFLEPEGLLRDFYDTLLSKLR